jgi:hypothetical protein
MYNKFSSLSKIVLEFFSTNFCNAKNDPKVLKSLELLLTSEAFFFKCGILSLKKKNEEQQIIQYGEFYGYD